MFKKKVVKKKFFILLKLNNKNLSWIFLFKETFVTFVWMVTMEILREVQESIRTTRRARNAPVMITLIPTLSEIVTRKLKVKVEIMLCTNKIKAL